VPDRQAYRTLRDRVKCVNDFAIAPSVGCCAIFNSLAHVDLGHAIGIAGEAHFVRRQFRRAGQANEIEIEIVVEGRVIRVRVSDCEQRVAVRAARILAEVPQAMQLRYLEILPLRPALSST
jgi:hypothetical protein